MLEIFIQKYGEWCGAAAAQLSMCQITAEVPFAFSNRVFFMTPPRQAMLPCLKVQIPFGTRQWIKHFEIPRFSLRVPTRIPRGTSEPLLYSSFRGNNLRNIKCFRLL
jgi:hypothetical protein